MNLFQRLRNALTGKQRSITRGRKPSAIPTIEALEDRLVPSTVSSVNNGTVIIDSNYFNPENDVTSVQVFANGRIEVTDTTGGGSTFSVRNGVNKIIYYGNGGSDELRINFNGSNVHFFSSFTVEAHMGSGNDVFTSRIRDDMNYSLFYRIYGDSGNDDLTLAGCETVPNRAGDNLTDGLATNTGGLRIFAGSQLNVLLDGGSGNDNIFNYYDGELDGHLRFKAVGGDGDDFIHVEMTLRTGSSGALFGIDGDGSARVEGNFGSDNLTFYVFDNGGAASSVQTQIDGGWGLGDWDVGQRTTNVQSSNLESDDID